MKSPHTPVDRKDDEDRTTPTSSAEGSRTDRHARPRYHDRIEIGYFAFVNRAFQCKNVTKLLYLYSRIAVKLKRSDLTFYAISCHK